MLLEGILVLKLGTIKEIQTASGAGADVFTSYYSFKGHSKTTTILTILNF